MKFSAALPYVEWIVRIALGGVFVWSSIGKIQDPGIFADAVMRYEILPEFAVGMFSLTLPMVELVAGCMLLTPWKKEAALLLSGLLVMFMVALSIAIALDLDIDCGCFGAEGETGRKWLALALLRDVPILAAALWLARPPAWRNQADATAAASGGERR